MVEPTMPFALRNLNTVLLSLLAGFLAAIVVGPVVYVVGTSLGYTFTIGTLLAKVLFSCLAASTAFFHFGRDS